jgi:hypothetical protein
MNNRIGITSGFHRDKKPIPMRFTHTGINPFRGYPDVRGSDAEQTGHETSIGIEPRLWGGHRLLDAGRQRHPAPPAAWVLPATPAYVFPPRAIGFQTNTCSDTEVPQ